MNRKVFLSLLAVAAMFCTSNSDSICVAGEHEKTTFLGAVRPANCNDCHGKPPPSAFGDYNEKLYDYSKDLDLAVYGIALSYFSNGSSALVDAYLSVNVALLLINDAAVFEGIDASEQKAALQQEVQNYTQASDLLIMAALQIFNGSKETTTGETVALIDPSAFAAALTNVANTPGVNASPGASDANAWSALWFLLYAWGDLANYAHVLKDVLAKYP